ncbi:MAG: lipopolysaccharide heptosyltransferase II [Planctomycetes bacterium]|nr:lipopolysaccharide heptosyltransferase II [Planctomycetota bacterium]
MKIAHFLPNWIGDAVMATPALRALRERYPSAEMVGVVRPYVADVVAGLDLLDRLVVWDPRSRCSGERGPRIAARLRRERLDMAVLYPNSLRSAWMAWLSGAKRRVGFATGGRGILLTDRLRPKSRRIPHPVIDEYLRLAAHLGCENPDRRMLAATLPEDEAALDRFWSRVDKSLPLRDVVCLNPGGAYGAAKHWPVASFATLARRMAVECGQTVLVLCGPGERDEARRIALSANHPAVVSLADEPPRLGLTKAAIRRASLLVTTDSGPRHFAAAFDVPVVTLFGPTHIAWSETYYAKAVHLQVAVDCGPCQQRACPLEHHRCMRDLSVERVFRASAELLQRYPASPKREKGEFDSSLALRAIAATRLLRSA